MGRSPNQEKRSDPTQRNALKRCRRNTRKAMTKTDGRGMMALIPGANQTLHIPQQPTTTLVFSSSSSPFFFSLAHVLVLLLFTAVSQVARLLRHPQSIFCVKYKHVGTLVFTLGGTNLLVQSCVADRTALGPSLFLASGCDDRLVRIWSVRSGILVRSCRGHRVCFVLCMLSSRPSRH